MPIVQSVIALHGGIRSQVAQQLHLPVEEFAFRRVTFTPSAVVQVLDPGFLLGLEFQIGRLIRHPGAGLEHHAHDVSRLLAGRGGLCVTHGLVVAVGLVAVVLDGIGTVAIAPDAGEEITPLEILDVLRVRHPTVERRGPLGNQFVDVAGTHYLRLRIVAQFPVQVLHERSTRPAPDTVDATVRTARRSVDERLVGVGSIQPGMVRVRFLGLAEPLDVGSRRGLACGLRFLESLLQFGRLLLRHDHGHLINPGIPQGGEPMSAVVEHEVATGVDVHFRHVHRFATGDEIGGLLAGAGLLTAPRATCRQMVGLVPAPQGVELLRVHFHDVVFRRVLTKPATVERHFLATGQAGGVRTRRCGFLLGGRVEQSALAWTLVPQSFRPGLRRYPPGVFRVQGFDGRRGHGHQSGRARQFDPGSTGRIADDHPMPTLVIALGDGHLGPVGQIAERSVLGCPCRGQG